VSHACNPGYSEGRDQEDLGSKPAQANSAQDPTRKPQHKKGLANGSNGKVPALHAPVLPKGGKKKSKPPDLLCYEM
jgi:hypothetical protein